MRRYKDGELCRIVCNKCGKEMKLEKGMIREGYFTADSRFGYFSGKDGIRQKFDLCEDCYDSWISTFCIPAEELQETELL